MRLEHEGIDYFKSAVFNSFDYKEAQIIEAVKANLNKHLDTFHSLNKYISAKAKVAHFANDYGELDVLLSLQESQRNISCFIADEEKRAVAKMNHYLKKRAIRYLENCIEITANKYDVVLISNANFEFDINEIVKITNCIILHGNGSLQNQIMGNGFEIEAVEKELIVLKKKS